MVQLVLGFEVEEQGWVAMLLEDCRGGEGAFQAVRAPVPHHTSKSPQRFSALLPVIGQVAKKGLDLARSPVLLNDGPFLGAKREYRVIGRPGDRVNKEQRAASLLLFSRCPDLPITRYWFLAHPITRSPDSTSSPPIVPKLETKEGPEYFPVVSPLAPMFSEKPAHKRDVEQPLAP